MTNIAKIYAKFVLKGTKKFANLPANIKDLVRQELINMKAPEELYSE